MLELSRIGSQEGNSVQGDLFFENMEQSTASIGRKLLSEYPEIAMAPSKQTIQNALLKEIEDYKDDATGKYRPDIRTGNETSEELADERSRERRVFAASYQELEDSKSKSKEEKAELTRRQTELYSRETDYMGETLRAKYAAKGVDHEGEDDEEAEHSDGGSPSTKRPLNRFSSGSARSRWNGLGDVPRTPDVVHLDDDGDAVELLERLNAMATKHNEDTARRDDERTERPIQERNSARSRAGLPPLT